MIIIGITGPIGNGKTTLAETLVRQVPAAVHLESVVLVSEVVDAWHASLLAPPEPTIESVNTWVAALPQIVARYLHVSVTFDQLCITQADVEARPELYQKLWQHCTTLAKDFSLARQDITADTKETYRPILQWVGGYLAAKVSPNIWYSEIVRRTKQLDAAGCPLVVIGGLRYAADAQELHNAGGIIVKLYRPGLPERDTSDPTERERLNILPDTSIQNNGTLEQLIAFAPKLLADIQTNTLRPMYATADVAS
jgi:RecA/RadA recombinase